MMLRGVLALVSLLMIPATAEAQHWPVEPADEDHPVMSDLEHVYDGVSHTEFLHRGLDIFAASWKDSSPAQIVAVGESEFCASGDACKSVGCEFGCEAGIAVGCDIIRTPGCFVDLKSGSRLFSYGHLQCDSYERDFVVQFETKSTVPDRAKIGRIMQWDDGCPSGSSTVYPNHLHFEVLDCTTARLISPATIVAPYDGALDDPPKIVEWHLVGDDASLPDGAGWTEFPPPSVSGTCTTVEQPADLVVGYETRHRAGYGVRHGDNLGARFVGWRACGGADPDCAWEGMYDWTSMPGSWGVANSYTDMIYSQRPPFETKNSFVCGDDTFYAVPTNMVRPRTGGPYAPTRAGALRPGVGPRAPADTSHVTASVYVEDFSGGRVSESRSVCLASGVPKLLVRDCADDDGAEPSPCTTWTDSPDIDVEAAPAGSASSRHLRVCVRNVGNDSIAAASDVGFVIGAETSGGSFPCSIATHALTVPASLLKTRAGGSVGAADWTPGEERCLLYPWPPPGTSALAGVGCDRVTVAVGRSGDTPNSYPTVVYDNNRAVRDLDVFTPIVVRGFFRTDLRLVGDPAAAASGRVEVAFDRFAPEERWWEPPRERPAGPVITLPARPYPDPYPLPEVEIHIGPGVRFGGVVGGAVVGVVSPTRYASWSTPSAADRPAAERSDDPGAAVGSWRIVVVPQGVERVAFVDAKVEAPGELRVFAWGGGPKKTYGLPGRVRVSVFARVAGGERLVEVFQKVSTYRPDERAAH